MDCDQNPRMPVELITEGILGMSQSRESLASPTFPILYEDILDTMFRDLVPQHLVACALVCQAWTEPAAKVMWRDLGPSMPRPLYNILLPLPRDSADLSKYFEEVSAYGPIR